MSLKLETGVWQCGMIGPAQMKEKGLCAPEKKAYPKCDEMYDLLTKRGSCC